MSWQQLAPFNYKGGFNEPYVLFKAKHVTNPFTRIQKWKTATRPIAPGTKHPMRRLLHLAGRAWYFIIRQYQGQHFAIHTTQEVPGAIKEMHLNLSAKMHKGEEIGCIIKDIKGCYPNMPKPAIQDALEEIVTKMQTQYSGVFIPRRGLQPCKWKTRGQQQPKATWKYAYIGFQDLLDIARFSMNHTIIKRQGKILKQISGIPMGDPLSPAMTIGTCCWMEEKWLESLQAQEKEMFKARRYMDDILLMYIKTQRWDNTEFIKKFEKSECYWPPLELEDGGQDTFLETRFKITRNNYLRMWLKNDNESETKIWRYQDFRSYGKYQQKKAILQAALRKVHHMASDGGMLYKSAQDKLREFTRAGYPKGVRRYVCVGLGHATGNEAWFVISKLQK